MIGKVCNNYQIIENNQRILHNHNYSHKQSINWISDFTIVKYFHKSGMFTNSMTSLRREVVHDCGISMAL